MAGHKTIEEANCVLCGQCITHCPVGALRERDDTEQVWEAIEDPEKIVVAQVAPAVRTAWAEELGLTPDEAPVGKILDALKKMGADYVFDTTFSADLTIMEEANEFERPMNSCSVLLQASLKSVPCLPPAVRAGSGLSSPSIRIW